MVKAVICGGGNGAHVLAGISSAEGNQVSVLTLFADEAERWNAKMKDHEFFIKHHKATGDEIMKAKPFTVTKSPEEAMKHGCEIIVLTVPAFAHAQYFTALKPLVKPGVVVVGLPGQPGFEFELRSIWGSELMLTCSIISYESLPWACRISEFGVSADVLGTKETMLGAVQPGKTAPPQDANSMMQALLGKFPVLTCKGHLLGITLMSPNGYIHPAILYGRWHDWDGKPLDDKPLFYHGVSVDAGAFATKVCDDIVAIAEGIMKQRPQVDLTNVSHLYFWYMRCYGSEITDKTNLTTAITTNRAYTGLTHPMKEADGGKWVPDFQNRYLSEDIPFGLAVMRGIASIANIPTPHIDKCLMWCQEKLGKEFLVNGEFKGKDINMGRNPLRYGLTDLDQILNLK